MMRSIFVLILTLCFALPAQAKTVYCTNCSTNMIQLLDRITNSQQLSTLLKDYDEQIQQTAAQLRMVQQNIEQYANMVQNTTQLPQNLVNELKGNMTRLAQLSSTLRTQRGDMTSLGEIFTNLFPEQGLFGDFAGATTPEQVAAAVEQYRHHWDTWSKNVDRASQATFQLSGQQLEDMQKDPQHFQSYLNDLLSTPSGQMQAIMSGNQLAALQIQETRQLRELMATTVQSELAGKMKTEKESQMHEEKWRELTTTKGDALNRPATTFPPY